MPTFSETASSFRSQLRLQEPSDSDSVRSSPAMFRSSSREGLFQPKAVASRPAEVETREGSSHQAFELQEDPSFWKDHNVQVVIRIRPLSNFEISLQGSKRCVRQESCQSVTWTGHPESRFTFDLVADENVSQEKLFKVAGLPMVENCMAGYNSCMFAYGQTGSGKTHTMLGDIEEGTRRHNVNCGMTPRVFEYLFSRIQKEKEARRDEKFRVTCKISFLEIYNEQILDLLDPSTINLQIREDAKKGIYVENLTEFEVTSARDAILKVVQGATNRKVATTNMNRASSRSHSVFTCIIESKWEIQGVTHHRFARLNLVDLAGSERQKSSGAEGERLKEATNINKSLSTLGLVIMNLVSLCNGKSLHVPYRDSKLTFLLQDSLGGNSKTTIIANISPSNCCSLETLSTLKFAQRAKFIKNNAIINEDASGDVLAMRMQILELKKEVKRLRGLVDGGNENEDTDNWSISFPGSPGLFKWDAVHESSSPVTCRKRASQKKDHEAALVGVLKRLQDKEIELDALVGENRAAVELAMQREKEIESLKMRLRFREAGIKRLEGVASGKLSAETHLLQENGELLREIEVLRNQVDRNQQVTKFAMENLRLNEEIRQLKSFCEDGERDRMNEQIMILQSKLLEALDWKLMHQRDPEIVQNPSTGFGSPVRVEDTLLASKEDPSSPWGTYINEETEFLRVQTIQNEKEITTLRQDLTFCLDANENLERRVRELASQLEEERKSVTSLVEASQQLRINDTCSSAAEDPSPETSNDQMELHIMVNAIAVASQREAEAHETAIVLGKENEELRMKLKSLLDNECQLNEMHEENEKLMGLYEKAMQERDDFKRKLAENEKVSYCPVKLVNIDQGEETMKVVEGCEAKVLPPNPVFSGSCGQDLTLAVEPKSTISRAEEQAYNEEIRLATEKLEMMEDKLAENEKLMGLYEKAMQERDDFKRKLAENEKVSYCAIKLVNVDQGEETMKVVEGCEAKVLPTNPVFSGSCGQDLSLAVEPKSTMSREEEQVYNEEIRLATEKLEMMEDKLANAAKALAFLVSLDKADASIQKLSRDTEVLESTVQVKELEITLLKQQSSEIQDRKFILENKFAALKITLSKFALSADYWEGREARASARLDAASRFVVQKEEVTILQLQKDEIETALKKAQQSEVELGNHIGSLKSKLQDMENQKRSEKVLFVIDNLDKTDVSSQRNWQCKAAELLRFEEERAKLPIELKKSRESLKSVQKEVDDLKRRSQELHTKIQTLELEINEGSHTMEEAKAAMKNVIVEKEAIFAMTEGGTSEVEKMIVEYQNLVFESDLKEAELELYNEELYEEKKRLEELRGATMVESQIRSKMLDENSWCLHEKVGEEIVDIQKTVLEAKSLLANVDR